MAVDVGGGTLVIIFLLLSTFYVFQVFNNEQVSENNNDTFFTCKEWFPIDQSPWKKFYKLLKNYLQTMSRDHEALWVNPFKCWKLHHISLLPHNLFQSIGKAEKLHSFVF